MKKVFISTSAIIFCSFFASACGESTKSLNLNAKSSVDDQFQLESLNTDRSVLKSENFAKDFSVQQAQFSGNFNPASFGNSNSCQLVEKDVLRKITVGISTPAGSGSGVVIGRNKNIHTIITAEHVLKSLRSGDESEIYSPVTKNYYPIKDIIIPEKESQDADIIIATFKSDMPLPFAVINAFVDKKNTMNFEANDWNLDTNGARGSGISMPSGAITVPVMRYTSMVLQDRVSGNANGYELIYEASTVPGMSGGPILGFRNIREGDSFSFDHPLIAIHGRSEEYMSGGGRSGMSLGVPVDLILPHLRKNSEKYGIPTSDEDINQSIRANFCN